MFTLAATRGCTSLSATAAPIITRVCVCVCVFYIIQNDLLPCRVIQSVGLKEETHRNSSRSPLAACVSRGAKSVRVWVMESNRQSGLLGEQNEESYVLFLSPLFVGQLGSTRLILAADVEPLPPFKPPFFWILHHRADVSL